MDTTKNIKIDNNTKKNLLELDRAIDELNARKTAIISTVINLFDLKGEIEIGEKYEYIKEVSGEKKIMKKKR